MPNCKTTAMERPQRALIEFICGKEVEDYRFVCLNFRLKLFIAKYETMSIRAFYLKFYLSLMQHSSHCRFALRRGTLFVFFQRWDFHQDPFRVGAMHRFAVVTQSLLRESFGIANGLGPFRPSVAVT